MKNSNSPKFIKVVFWGSLYYLICYSISLLIFFYAFVENLFSSNPVEQALSYIFQLIVISLLVIFININYKLVFKETTKTLLYANIIFSIFQLVSFKLSSISYLICFATDFCIMIGNKENYELQLISILFFPQSIISTFEKSELWFISINFIPLSFIVIMIYALTKIKKSDNYTPPQLLS